MKTYIKVNALQPKHTFDFSAALFASFQLSPNTRGAAVAKAADEAAETRNGEADLLRRRTVGFVLVGPPEEGACTGSRRRDCRSRAAGEAARRPRKLTAIGFD